MKQVSDKKNSTRLFFLIKLYTGWLVLFSFILSFLFSCFQMWSFTWKGFPKELLTCPKLSNLRSNLPTNQLVSFPFLTVTEGNPSPLSFIQHPLNNSETKIDAQAEFVNAFELHLKVLLGWESIKLMLLPVLLDDFEIKMCQNYWKAHGKAPKWCFSSNALLQKHLYLTH
jgi:hypothetical protein